MPMRRIVHATDRHYKQIEYRIGATVRTYLPVSTPVVTRDRRGQLSGVTISTSSYPGDVFERLTDGARRAVVLAREEARLQNRNYIGTEHLLLGLIHQGEGVAAKALESLGILLETVRLQVEEIVAPSSEPPAAGLIPFSPRAKKALELAVRESFQLGHDEVGTEHILLGLVREGEGVAARVLRKLGADQSHVRARVMQLTPGDLARIHHLTIADIIEEDEARWSVRAERFLMRHRWVPSFLIGWPTWFGNRRASGIRGIPGDLAYLRDSLFKRGNYGD